MQVQVQIAAAFLNRLTALVLKTYTTKKKYVDSTVDMCIFTWFSGWTNSCRFIIFFQKA